MASKNYYSRLLPLVLAAAALACLPPLQAQISSGHMKTGAPQKVAGKRNAAVQTRISCTVDPGFHVNSNTPSEDYLVPLKLTWTSPGALQPGEVVYPKPTLEKYEFATKPLSVVTGRFDLVANFKVAPNAPAGPGMANGRLRYQACNDKACFQPKTIEIAVPYQVE